MNKLTKGSLATGAGLVLLLGGTGTFMSWQDTANSAGTNGITAGHLRLSEASAVGWTDSAGNTIADITQHEIVPGETLTYSATLEVDALGDNLGATVTLADGSIAAVESADTTQSARNTALATDLGATAVLDASGAGFTKTATEDVFAVAEGENQLVTVTAAITFPTTVTSDASMDGQVNLNGMAVTLNQTTA